MRFSLLTITACFIQCALATPDEGLTFGSWVNWQDNYTISQVQGSAYNSGHRVGTYTSLDASQVKAQIVRYDTTRRGCTDRIYSHSRNEAVQAYKDFVLRQKPYAHDPSEEKYSSHVLKIVADPANAGVFSSLHRIGGKDNGAPCSYYHFYVFRNDKTLIDLRFDYTD